MAEPLIFVFTYAIKDGHLEDYEKHLPELFELVEANEPRLIAMHTYIDDEVGEATTILIQPDADAQTHHMKVAVDKLNEGYQFLDFTTLRIEVCGAPGETALASLRGLEEQGVSVSIKSRHGGGVDRFPAL